MSVRLNGTSRQLLFLFLFIFNQSFIVTEQRELVWDFAAEDPTRSEEIQTVTGYSLLSCRILQNRVAAGADVEQWIAPRLENVLDPHDLPWCEEAAERLARAMADRETIGIFSDYDVDGISSAALVSDALRSLGTIVRTFLPDRMEEGYGLTRKALERAFADGTPGLLLVLDCGTRSDEELAWLSARGVSVIVVDHHARPDAPRLPENCILVNPHLPDRAGEAFRIHCTAGLCFKLLHALTRSLRKRGVEAREEFDLRSGLDLVALGTVADLVPLTGENRILTHHGLRALARTARPGLRALCQVSGVE